MFLINTNIIYFISGMWCIYLRTTTSMPSLRSPQIGIFFRYRLPDQNSDNQACWDSSGCRWAWSEIAGDEAGPSSELGTGAYSFPFCWTQFLPLRSFSGGLRCSPGIQCFLECKALLCAPDAHAWPHAPSGSGSNRSSYQGNLEKILWLRRKHSWNSRTSCCQAERTVWAIVFET